MPHAILAYEDGKPKVIIVSQIKAIEVEPAVPEEPEQPAQEAVEGHPGVPADPVTGLGGEPPVEKKEAKEAVPGKPGVPETVVVDGVKLGMTAEQFVHLLNKMIRALVIVTVAMLLTSCAPLLVGGLIGGAIVAHHHYRDRGLCQLPNGVLVRCHPRRYWVAPQETSMIGALIGIIVTLIDA